MGAAHAVVEVGALSERLGDDSDHEGIRGQDRKYGGVESVSGLRSCNWVTIISCGGTPDLQEVKRQRANRQDGA